MASTQVLMLKSWLHSHLSALDSTKVFLIGVDIFKKAEDVNTQIQHQLLVVKRAESEEAFPNDW